VNALEQKLGELQKAVAALAKDQKQTGTEVEKRLAAVEKGGRERGRVYRRSVGGWMIGSPPRVRAALRIWRAAPAIRWARSKTWLGTPSVRAFSRSPRAFSASPPWARSGAWLQRSRARPVTSKMVPRSRRASWTSPGAGGRSGSNSFRIWPSPNTTVPSPSPASKPCGAGPRRTPPDSSSPRETFGRPAGQS